MAWKFARPSRREGFIARRMQIIGELQLTPVNEKTTLSGTTVKQTVPLLFSNPPVSETRRRFAPPGPEGGRKVMRKVYQVCLPVLLGLSCDSRCERAVVSGAVSPDHHPSPDASFHPGCQPHRWFHQMPADLRWRRLRDDGGRDANVLVRVRSVIGLE